MRIFKINQTGWVKINGEKMAMLDNLTPIQKAVGMKATIGWGEPIEKYLPKKIKLQIEKSKNNGKLANLIGNLVNVLTVDKIIKDIIEEINTEKKKIELIQFSLYSSLGKLLNDDLYLINPIGYFDCIDKSKSEIKYHMNLGVKQVLSIKQLVLSKDKVENAPCIFKISEEPSSCFINIHLARMLKENNCENILLEEIEIN